MILTALDWAVIVSYFVVSLGIGLYYSRRAGKNITEFFVSGRSLPWWLAGTSMVATTFAADTPLAVTGLVVKYGVAGNWFWWAMAIGGMFTVFVFARLWRRAEVMTDVELVELRYGGKPAAFLRGFRSSISRDPDQLHHRGLGELRDAEGAEGHHRRRRDARLGDSRLLSRHHRPLHDALGPVGRGGHRHDPVRARHGRMHRAGGAGGEPCGRHGGASGEGGGALPRGAPGVQLSARLQRHRSVDERGDVLRVPVRAVVGIVVSGRRARRRRLHRPAHDVLQGRATFAAGDAVVPGGALLPAAVAVADGRVCRAGDVSRTSHRRGPRRGLPDGDARCCRRACADCCWWPSSRPTCRRSRRRSTGARRTS